MIKTVWQQRRQSNSGHKNKRLHGGSGHREVPVVEENSSFVGSVKNSGKSKWKIYKNSRIKKGLNYLGISKSDDKLNQVSTDAVPIENDVILKNDQLVIPKTDKNWIRIHVSYDEEQHLTGSNGVSEVNISYDHKNLQYNESAIDVPKDYCKCNCCNTNDTKLEHRNYRHRQRQNNLRRTIEEFLQEDLVQREHDGQQTVQYVVDDCYGHHKRFHQNKLNKQSFQKNSPARKPYRMGVNCSTAFTKLRHHSVGPTPDTNLIIVKENNIVADKKLHTPPPPPTPRAFDKNDNIKNTPIKNTPLRRLSCFENPKPSTYEDLLKNNLSVPPALSSSIEWDNILHRRNDVVRSPKRNLVNSSTQTQSPDRNHNNNNNANLSVNSNKQNLRVTSNRLSSSSSSSLATTTSWGTKHGGGSTNRESGSFLKNFSGSVQNLVNFQFINRTERLRSASENNLSRLSNAKLNKKTPKMHSSNLEMDYCPSVLYNRKQVADLNASNKKDKSVNLRNFKKFFNNINLPRIRRNRDGNGSIQDIDGAFFEKFGSLLRQKSQMDETVLAPLPEEETAAEFTPMMARIDEAENDSGTETLPETDSEPDDPRAKQERLIEDAVGMNIDELYEEVLYEILHNIGCEDSSDVNQNTLFEYIQEAFKVSNEKHDEILKAAESKEPPQIRLNVEVVKAENLLPKDSNGFSDPFVTLYIESCSTHRYNTSVKSATLNPLWEEHFSLPIPENPNSEILILEVWDFDPAETVSEKMGKFFEVKGVKGFGKLMKEIAITASTGKHDNELIGRASIPLKTIPVSGIQVWYSLEKANRTKSRGAVLVRMSFSAEKNSRVAAQEHRNLLRLLLLHELETSKVAQHWWSGKFSAQGEAILQQHLAQSGLQTVDCALAQWSTFTNIHQDHPLAFSLFISLLDKILSAIETLPSDDDEVKLFWEGVKKLLPSCFSTIRKIRKKTAGDKNCVKMLSEVLDILSKISSVQPPEGTDLFPKQVYGWITREEGVDVSLKSVISDAVRSGASEWFETINEGSECRNNASEEDRLQHMIKLIQLIRSDLQRAIEYYDKHFQMKMNFTYAQTLYQFYEVKVAEACKPVVEDVCRNIRRIQIPESKFEKLPEHEEINMGTTLFELYLVLKRFSMLGTALCPDETLAIDEYHIWFTPGVTHWLDISVYKALTRIEKAIELDKLVPVDDTVKYSSSAVDTLAIFYQIKIFWQQLGWPDVEGAYMFVGKIVDDICRCCVFYADKMSQRMEEMNQNEDLQRFEVTSEWCLAINNIDYIRQSLSPFIKELGADEIIARLSEFRSELEADRCAQTLRNVIENAIDTERNKILELIEVVAKKMSPAMRRFLTEGAEILHADSNSMDRLMMYMEESLKTLHMELNEVNFERTLDAIWTELSVILYDLVHSNLDKRRPPAFFANLRDTLHLMVSSFKLQQNSERSCSDREILENIERLLELHAYETGDLIHQYYLERLADQQNMTETPYGQLTVRCCFKDNVLQLEIMNGRNLVPMDSNGNCDSFVKVHFMPAERFIGIACPKTSTQHKTLFPLYDEKFAIVLTDTQRNMSNALIVLSVKDKDLFGMSNQYIAECYLPFGDIEKSHYEQIHLTLNRPVYKETPCIQVLEHRTGDKQAREFLKKLKQKSAP